MHQASAENSHLGFDLSRISERALLYFAFSGVFLSLLLPLGMQSTASTAFTLAWSIALLLHAGAMLFLFFQLLLVCKRRSSDQLREILLWVLIVFTLVLGLLYCIVPITSRDALLYHLYVPRLWIEAGRIHEIPWHEWSYFPLLLSLAYTGMLAQGLEWLTPYFHFSFLIGTAALVALYLLVLEKRVSHALFAFLLLLSLPLCLRFGTEPMADFGVAFYFAAGIFALFLLPRAACLQTVLLPGVFFGLAISSKYSAVLGLSLVLPLIALYLFRKGFSLKRAFVLAVIIGATAFGVNLPWLVKNFLWTSNPFHPFLGTFFGSSQGTPFVGETSALLYRHIVHEESWLQILLIPLRMLFVGADDLPKYFDGVLSPLLVFLWIPVIQAFRKRSESAEEQLLVGIVLLYGASSLILFHALVRYQLLLLAPAVILAVLGIDHFARRIAPKRTEIIFSLLLALHALMIIPYHYQRFQKLELGALLANRLTPEDYLLEHGGEYRIAQYINQALPKDAVVYLLYTGNRFYYYQPELRGYYFSAEPLLKLFREKGEQVSVADLSQSLRRLGVSHLVIHHRRLDQVLRNSLSEQELEIWQGFVRSELKLFHRQPAWSVWELASEQNKS